MNKIIWPFGVVGAVSIAGLAMFISVNAAPTPDGRDFESATQPYLAYSPGVGTDEISCAQYIDSNAKPRQKFTLRDGTILYTQNLLLEHYISGYITGSNSANRDRAKQVQMDLSDVHTAIQNYCIAHPDEGLLDAIDGFTEANTVIYKDDVND